MSTVLQLNEASLRLIFGAKEDLSDLITITDATFAGTFVSTQAYAWVATLEDLGTGLCAWQTIAWLIAKLTAALVRAVPSTGLNARSTRLPTLIHTFAMDTAVLTRSLTGRAVFSARLTALVRTNEETLALVKTGGVEASLITSATGATTGMTAF